MADEQQSPLPQDVNTFAHLAESGIPFGVWLKTQRRLQDFSQATLAHLVGISVSTLKKYEQGQRRPSQAVIDRIGAALQISVADSAALHTYARRTSGHHNVFGSHTGLKQGGPLDPSTAYNGSTSEPLWANWSVILHDEFVDDRHNWAIGSDLQGSNMEEHGLALKQFRDGAFYLTLHPHSRLGFGWSGGLFYPVPDIYYVGVDVLQQTGHSGDSCGIMFGATDNSNYYLFTVRGFDRQFLVTGVRDDANWDEEPAIRPRYAACIQRDVPNRLELLAQDNEFQFFINGTHVGSATIPSRPGNFVDVVVIAREHRVVTGVFQRFEIRTPDVPERHR